MDKSEMAFSMSWWFIRDGISQYSPNISSVEINTYLILSAVPEVLCSPVSRLPRAIGTHFHRIATTAITLFVSR